MTYIDTLLELAKAAVFTVHSNGGVEPVTSTAMKISGRIFGYNAQELDNIPIYQLLPTVFSKQISADGAVRAVPDPRYLDGELHEITATRKNNEKFVATVLIKEAVQDSGEFVYIVRVRDITQRRRVENDLKTREQHLKILLETTKAGLLTIDQNGLIRAHNNNTARMFGFENNKLIDFPIYQVLPQVFSQDEDKDGASAPILNPLFMDEKMHETEVRPKNNPIFPATIMVRKTMLDGKPAHIVRIRDVTDKKATEAKLHSRQQRLETILNNAAEGIIVFDERGVIESFNRAAEKLFGYEEKDVVGQTISLLIPPDLRDRREGYLDHFMRAEIKRLLGHEGEVIGRHKDGAKFHMALKVSAMTIDGKQLYTGLVADISERKAMVEHLKNMAEHDGLTGLYNRGYLQAELERVVERSKRTGGQDCALLYIDLDNFKYVNDTIGHAAGDRVLVEVAAILNKRARKSDLIARLGGDEFAVLLYNTNAAQAAQVADSFREQMSNYVFKEGAERVDIGCSIGVSPINATTKSAGESMSQADIACHLAKRAGRNRIHVFKAADETGLTSMSLDMGWSRRIREAIKQDRFALACQPIINVASGIIDSYEVLIRMLDDNDELIMPSGFLPAAERFGLISDIDKWVIVNAIDTLTEQRKVLPNLRYAINLSGQTLSDSAVADLILAKLHATGLDPLALTFEVTETVAIADMKTAESFLARLQAIGCETALDDFGAGFSSFAYLRDLPVDCVKIDGRFVKNLAKNPVDQAMVKAMNEIAHALGKKTVAEFVENAESLALLEKYGVDYAQGYHLGRPDVVMPCKAIADYAGQPGMCKIG